MSHEPARGVRIRAGHNALLPTHTTADMSKPVVVNVPEPLSHDSEGSGSGDDEGQYQFAPPVSTTPMDEVPPLNGGGGFSWSASNPPRMRENPPPIQTTTTPNGTTTASSSRPPRPGAVRTPSNAYALAQRTFDLR